MLYLLYEFLAPVKEEEALPPVKMSASSPDIHARLLFRARQVMSPASLPLEGLPTRTALRTPRSGLALLLERAWVKTGYERAARHHTILVSLSILNMAYALQLVCRCVTSTVLRLLPKHRSMGGKCATFIAMQKCCSACSHVSAEIRNMRSHQNCCKYMFAKIVRSKHA